MQRQSRERIGGADGTDLQMVHVSFVEKFSLECSLKSTETITRTTIIWQCVPNSRSRNWKGFRWEGQFSCWTTYFTKECFIGRSKCSNWLIVDDQFRQIWRYVCLLNLANRCGNLKSIRSLTGSQCNTFKDWVALVRRLVCRTVRAKSFWTVCSFCSRCRFLVLVFRSRLLQ